MAYKTILLHLNDVRRAGRLLEATVPLARALDAHLLGLSVLPPYVVIPAVDGGGVSVTVEQHRTAYAEEMAQIKRLFDSATSDLARPAEWRQGDASFGSVAQVVMEAGRAADLVVLSQADATWGSSSLLEDPVRVAMECGRPVLLIPNSGALKLPARRITVAWNGQRESARAVFDALPMLQTADDVSVVWVNPEKSGPLAGDLPSAEICASLARHGVKCTAIEAHAIGADVGPEIMHQAQSFGSNLLVMGCYGHSRLREFVLGGASRDILAGTTMPVLLSH